MTELTDGVVQRREGVTARNTRTQGCNSEQLVRLPGVDPSRDGQTRYVGLQAEPRAPLGVEAYR